MRRDLGRVFRSPVETMANWACALKVLGNEAEERGAEAAWPRIH
jgi:hypothetical protein